MRGHGYTSSDSHNFERIHKWWGGNEQNHRHIMAQAISVQSTTSRIYFRRRKTNLVAK